MTQLEINLTVYHLFLSPFLLIVIGCIHWTILVWAFVARFLWRFDFFWKPWPFKTTKLAGSFSLPLKRKLPKKNYLVRISDTLPVCSLRSSILALFLVLSKRIHMLIKRIFSFEIIERMWICKNRSNRLENTIS